MSTLGNPVWFGRYRLTSRIATGGMAEVYLGRFVTPTGKFGPMVAVKRLLPHLVKDSQVVRMFLNEARITAQIDHPNVVKVLDLGHVEGEPYIAMELLEGRSFADLRQRAAEAGKHVPLGITLRVLTEACKGLDAAHRAVDEEGRKLCIVHRDFTPDNIHVNVDGSIKVIDFGIAKAQSWGAGTEPGTLKGKFFYMSPEMISGQPVDHRADLFAAGVMLYEQLCGRRPFTGLSTDEVVMRIAGGRLRRPTDFDPSVPQGLEDVCLKALRKDPAERFPSLTEFVGAIEAVGGAAQVATREAVAEYMGELFPAGKDQTRLSITLARKIDPSIPGAAAAPSELPVPDTGLHSALVLGLSAQEVEQLALLQGQEGQDADHAPEPADDLGAGHAPEPADDLGDDHPPEHADEGPLDARRAPGNAGRSESQAQEALDADGLPDQAPGRSRRTRVVAVGALVVVAGLAAAGAVLWPNLSAAPPPQRLAAAAKTDSGVERAKLLKGLALDERASEVELARAGQLLWDAKAYDAALAHADAWQRRSARSLNATMLEARAATRLRMGKRAEAAIARAEALAPGDVAPDLLLAELREAQGDLPGALEGVSRAAKKRPGDLQLVFRKGLLLSASGRLDEAAATLTAALHKGFDARAAAELGFVRYRQKQNDEAIDVLKRAIARDPQLPVAHYYLAAALFAKGEEHGPAAEKEYLEADRLDPADSRPLVALCELQKHRGSVGLEQTRKQIQSRFKEKASALLARCAP